MSELSPKGDVTPRGCNYLAEAIRVYNPRGYKAAKLAAGFARVKEN
jgi:hypothetical protein